MLERVIIAIGGLVGLGSALLFHYAVQHLRLPALLYAIVDLFGVLVPTGTGTWRLKPRSALDLTLR